jgi:hypothetical protein
MAKCKECYCEHGTLFDALESIIWYNGHYEWMKELRDELVQYREERHFPKPDDIEWHTEQHTIWMLLVGMFGDWGTSIRSGWLQEIDDCIEFIDAVCKMSWEAEERDAEDGK